MYLFSYIESINVCKKQIRQFIYLLNHSIFTHSRWVRIRWLSRSRDPSVAFDPLNFVFHFYRIVFDWNDVSPGMTEILFHIGRCPLPIRHYSLHISSDSSYEVAAHVYVFPLKCVYYVSEIPSHRNHASNSWAHKMLCIYNCTVPALSRMTKMMLTPDVWEKVKMKIKTITRRAMRMGIIWEKSIRFSGVVCVFLCVIFLLIYSILRLNELYKFRTHKFVRIHLFLLLFSFANIFHLGIPFRLLSIVTNRCCCFCCCRCCGCAAMCRPRMP